MRSYRWLFGCLGAGMLVLVACAPELPTDPGYHLFNGAGGHAVVSPDAYMAVAGCVPHAAPKDSSTIVFPLVGGGMARFDCRAPADRGVTAAIQAYRGAAFARTGAVMAPGGGDDGYVYLHTYSCDIWMLGVVAMGALGIAGCSSSAAVGPGYFLVPADGSSSLVSPVEFMTSSGCSFLGRKAVIGAIVVPRADTGFNLFDCTRLGRDSLKALVGEYRHRLNAAKLHGASVVVHGAPISAEAAHETE